MEKIDGFKSGKKWEKNIWSKFLENIENSGRKHEAAAFLDSILTESEKKFISKRLAALALIKSGRSYREIGKILWISPCTISAISKIVNEPESYKSNREYRTKRKNEKRKGSREMPPYTILDYWASLPLPSKSGYRRYKHK